MSVNPEKRIEILKRDWFTCQDCGAQPLNLKYLHVHHIKPIRDGGTDDLSNLVLLCHRCHFQRPEDYNYRSKKVSKGTKIRLHTPICGECHFDCRAIDATLFSGQVAILLQCTNGHLTIKYVSPERYFEN